MRETKGKITYKVSHIKDNLKLSKPNTVIKISFFFSEQFQFSKLKSIRPIF
jgi:hypothetical protein